MTATQSLELSPPSSAMTIATYERLASEYDEPRHATTRALERLSGEAFRRMRPLERARAAHPALLELGAGTGALTREILAAGGWDRLIVTDPAPAMCARLHAIVAGFDRAEVHACDAHGALSRFGPSADVVLAGLADPFLDADTLAAARAFMPTESVLFVTVPSRSWATREREWRLGIPVERTRFRLHDGTQLEAASWTYDERELGELLLDAAFRLIGSGTRTAGERVNGARPEVTWALARST